ncbi:MAG: PilW family protein [Methylibium sp.]|uniref:PilW family protein n=1 Tax=Methylibium sp. TaxID=2067992 RepID=UPI0018435590|nr:PilW family protein [Methylibium sp.]MBA3598221.1 PilW family protein [Methylibium sp.]
MKPRTTPSLRRGTRGFSLIELMVGVAIALVVTLVIFSVLSVSESRRRTTSSLNDIGQSGSYATYLLDRAIRSAGSGLTSRWDETIGCLINASRSSTQILPRTAALPAPFAAVTADLRLAPVVIAEGQSAAGSDVLMVMAGSSGFGEVAAQAEGPTLVADGPGVLLRNTIGFGGGDLVLLANQPDCLLSQVEATQAGTAVPKDASSLVHGADPRLLLDGAYYTASGSTVNLADITDTAVAASIGNVAAANPPQFRLYGVGDNQTLFSYDLLRIDGSDAALPIAEGVMQLRAVYGVDTDNDRVLDAWVAPTGTTWGADALLSPAGAANLRNILAVRFAVVLRSSLVERTDVAPASLPLFADLPDVATTVTIATGERNFRYRVIESTIPLRNTLLLPAL